MKKLFLICKLFIYFVISSSTYAQGNKFYTNINWPRMQSFPGNFIFEGEITGYLSVFKIEGSWHVYLYRSREALKDHDETSFVKIDDIEFRNILGIVDFSGNEKLLKSLDQRFVRIAGLFKTAELTLSDVPFFGDKIFSMTWRGNDGKWTSNQKNGLDESPLKAGRLLAFPNAVFFTDMDQK